MNFQVHNIGGSGRHQAIDYTPNVAVSAGSLIAIGGVACFAVSDIPANTLGALIFSGGVWGGAKDASVWTPGQRIYWNPTGNPNVGTAGTGCFTNAPGSGFIYCGIAVQSPGTAAGALTGDQYGYFAKETGAGNSLRAVAAQITTVTAADTIVTGLNTVVSVVASLDSDPTDNPEWVTATIGNQSGAPAAGSVIIKTWQNTAGNDPTPLASTTFGKKVNYVAYGY